LVPLWDNLQVGDLEPMPLPTLCAFALLTSSPPAKEIMRRCQHAYDSVKTFRESVRGTTNSFGSTAEITFLRPGHLMVKGTSMFKSPYGFVFDGVTAWSLTGSAWTQEQSAEIGIAKITGISGTTGSTVPALLLHTSWASLGQFEQPGAKVTMATVSGRKAYKLSVTKPFSSSIWVDAATDFLLRSESKVMSSTIVVTYGAPRVDTPISARIFKHG
jgi:hypothetical protein